MKMLIQSRNHLTYKLVYVLLLVFIFGFFFSLSSAEAATVSLTDGGGSEDIITLNWLIRDLTQQQINDCVITGTNGFRYESITTERGSVNNNTGGETVTYTLTCAGISSVVRRYPPSIDLSIDGGTNKTQAQITTGIITVRWDTDSNRGNYTVTSCDEMRYRKSYSSSMTRFINQTGVTENILGNRSARLAGSVVINNALNRTLIIGPTKFGIKCYSSTASKFASIDMTVDGVEMRPDPIGMGLRASPESLEVPESDPRVRLSWFANGVADMGGTCTYTAKNTNTNAPLIYDGWNNLPNNRAYGTDILYRLATSTTFTISCQRPAPYADSETMSIAIRVIPNPAAQITYHSLDVNSSGASGVAITANSPAYAGNTNYRMSIASGTPVVLTAPATSGTANFSSWTGCNTTNITARTCNVTMNAGKTVAANYSIPLPNLTSHITPTVNGPLTQGQSVTFNGQVRNSGSVSVNSAFSNNFTYRWSTTAPWQTISSHSQAPLAVGGTRNDLSSNLTLSQTGTLYVQHCIDSGGQIPESNESPADNCKEWTFTVSAIPTHTLTVNSSGAPGVAITANAATYNGTTNYTRSINSGTAVVLTAPATSGTANFSSWAGCDTTNVTARTCNVTMNAGKTVTANYSTPTHNLTVNSSGASGVAITASSPTYAGTTNYTRSVNSGTAITLTAPLVPGNTFTSWTGCDTTNAAARTCAVTMNAAKTVTANYSIPPNLDLSASGVYGVISARGNAAITGIFQSVNYGFTMGNIGNVPVSSNIPWRLSYTPDSKHATFNNPSQFTNPSNPIHNSNRSGLAVGASVPLANTFTNVPFGTNRVCATSSVGNSLPEGTESNTSNNQSCTSITLAPLEPPMSIESSSYFIRHGKTVEITYNVLASYPSLVCSVRGAGGVKDDFTPSTAYPDPYEGTITTTPLTSKSEILLRCTEGVTGAEFDQIITIEVIPDNQEI